MEFLAPWFTTTNFSLFFHRCFLNCIGYIAPNGRMTASNELGRIQMRVILSCFSVLSWHLPVGFE
jgi:hypothetical protein